MIDRKVSGNKTEMLQFAQEFVRRIAKARQPLERLWYRSLLFDRGEQWITFEDTLRQFRRTNEWKSIPRVVTNRYGETRATLVSHLTEFDPKVVFAPQTDKEDDIKTSIAANKIIKALENEINWPKRKAEWLPWFVLTGNAWLVDGIDPEAGPLKTVQNYKCRQCGDEADSAEDITGEACESCEDQGQVGFYAPIVDEQGLPETSQKPTPQMACDVATPFEMYCDASLVDLNQHHTLVRIQTKDLDWVRTTFKDKTIGPVEIPEVNVRYSKYLSYIVPQSSKPAAETADVMEVWHKPSYKFKYGFYMVAVGDKIIRLKTYPFISEQGQVYFPIVHIPYHRIPGSFYGTTPMFDIIEPQKSRNRAQAMNQMTQSRMANPVWVMPKPGTSVPPTGYVGQILEFDAYQTNGQRPSRDEGADIKPGTMKTIEQYDVDIDRLAGIAEITRGERPLSVKTGYALQKLEDASKHRSTSVFDNIATGTAEHQWLMLELFRSTQAPDKFARVLGENAQWTISKLGQADLKGGVDTWAESTGSYPKNHLERLAQIEVFMDRGILNVQDPVTVMKICKEFGVDDIFPELGVEENYIAREMEKMQQGQPIQPGMFDNDAVHMARHTAYIKGEEFETLPPQVKQIIMQHTLLHQQRLVQQQMAMQQQQQGGPQ